MGTLLLSTRETVVTQHGFIPLLLTWEEVGTYLLHLVMTEVSPEASKPSAAVRSALLALSCSSLPLPPAQAFCGATAPWDPSPAPHGPGEPCLFLWRWLWGSGLRESTMKWEAIPGPGLLILHACWDGSVLPGRSGALLQVWICKSWHFPGHRQQQSLGWLEPQAVHHFAWPQLKASEAQSGRGPRMSHVASSSLRAGRGEKKWERYLKKNNEIYVFQFWLKVS